MTHGSSPCNTSRHVFFRWAFSALLVAVIQPEAPNPRIVLHLKGARWSSKGLDSLEPESANPQTTGVLDPAWAANGTAQ